MVNKKITTEITEARRNFIGSSGAEEKRLTTKYTKHTKMMKEKYN